MKALRQVLYRDMLSVLCNPDRKFRSSTNVAIIQKTVLTYPSKSLDCLCINRIISYIDRSITSITLIIETMKDEEEDQEIIDNIEKRMNDITIRNDSEVKQLLAILADYVKWSKLLKRKDSFIQSFDMLSDDVSDQVNIHGIVESLYEMASGIVADYNSILVHDTAHTFDSNNLEQMQMLVAQTQDVRDSKNVILTGIRGLNMLLSPGYVAGSVYVFAGLPGNYKSGILLESHVDTCRFNPNLKAITNGKTPVSVYITMENTLTQTISRLWSILYPNADISTFTTKEATDMINEALSVNGCRSVILYYGYREKSTRDIDAILSALNDDKNQVVALFFDYIKRVRPGRTDAAVNASEKTELNAIMNEFKTIAAKHGIPVVTGHQLNRAAAAEVDALIAKGIFNKSDTVLNRSNLSVAWEVLEVADFAAVLNIENDGENKTLMIKAIKQRDLRTDANDNSRMASAIRHPFTSMNSFALQPDINEVVSICIPIFTGIQNATHMANI